MQIGSLSPLKSQATFLHRQELGGLQIASLLSTHHDLIVTKVDTELKLCQVSIEHSYWFVCGAVMQRWAFILHTSWFACRVFICLPVSQGSSTLLIVLEIRGNSNLALKSSFPQGKAAGQEELYIKPQSPTPHQTTKSPFFIERIHCARATECFNPLQLCKPKVLEYAWIPEAS